MRKLFSLFVFNSMISYCLAATVYWDGGGDGISWNDNLNWVGNVTPGPADDVVLDNSQLSSGYSVTLPLISVIINSLVITPSAPNVISLTLPAGNTNNPGLSISGGGDALVLNAGAVLKNSSGASAGTGISISGSFRINNGGKYIHNTARGNAAIVSQLSSATGTESGEFEFDVPASSYTPSLSNRTYGTLTFSALANGGSVTYVGSGANDVNINGNLNINTGVTVSLSLSADMIIDGDYNQAASSTFNLQSSTFSDTVRIAGDLLLSGTITESNTGLPVLELVGSSPRTISGSGTMNNSINFRMNTTSGGYASLNSPLTLPYKLTLTSGKIFTSLVNILILPDEGIAVGGNSASFVIGPMKKIGNDNFVFPVGAGNIYAPLGIANGSGENSTDEYIAEFKRTNPQNVYGNNYAAGIDHISFVEYWTLAASAGTASKIISLDVHQASFCLVPATTFISRFNGAQWTNEPSSASVFSACGSYQCGTITSMGAFSNFGAFTLATNDPFAVNPLPIELVSFNAERQRNFVSVHWELGEYCSKESSFEVQRSNDSSHFNTIRRLMGNESSRFYQTTDQLNTGITYYRLKIIDQDGFVSFSPVVAIWPGKQELLMVSMLSNPVGTRAVIVINTDRSTLVNLAVCDISGRHVKQWQWRITKGRNQMEVDLTSLPAGIYRLIGTSDKATAVAGFVKSR